MPEDAQAARWALIAAGGTGGHLFPAQALAEALKKRGWRIALATDARVEGFAAAFPAERRFALSAATFRRGDQLGAFPAALAIGRGILQAAGALREIRPSVVIGFGGYPSLPALIAAILSGRPTVIHEANAVLGRANRFLAPQVTAVACAFPSLLKASARVRSRAIVVGNPVRPQIAALAGQGYAPPQGEIRLLITGGSQGARLLSELMPAAIASLPEALRRAIKVEQQTRPESLENARSTYATAQVRSEVATFFADMASRLAAAHLVVGRSGASTVSELAVAGRPAILVPLALALDDDQGRNAEVLRAAGAAEIFRENQLTAPAMADALERLLTSPDRLSAMAAAAAGQGRPDAAERLADVVERVA